MAFSLTQQIKIQHRGLTMFEDDLRINTHPDCEDAARDEAAMRLYLITHPASSQIDWVALGDRRNDYYKAIDAGWCQLTESRRE